MSTTEESSAGASGMPGTGSVDMKLRVPGIPLVPALLSSVVLIAGSLG